MSKYTHPASGKHMIVKNKRLQTKKRIAALLTLCMVVLIGVALFIASQKKTAEQPKEGIVQQDLVNGQANKPLWDSQLYVEPQSRPAEQAALWRTSQPKKADLMERLAQLPVAHWVTSPEAAAMLPQHMQRVGDKTTVLVSYYLPYRDCGRYSAGGAKDANEYKKFINNMVAAIGSTKTVVILEPDAVANLKSMDDAGKPCLQGDKQRTYYSLLSYAVGAFKSLPSTLVYVDAGHSMWVTDTAEVAGHLAKVNIAAADGFSLNVSNFQPTADNIKYGEAISAKLGGKHFVIDTSRNGLGAFTNKQYPTHSWCNPPGRALGHYPTTQVGHKLVDAYLYIKRPGESDGADPVQGKCFGGPKAGDWWPDYAIGLIERWPRHLQP